MYFVHEASHDGMCWHKFFFLFFFYHRKRYYLFDNSPKNKM